MNYQYCCPKEQKNAEQINKLWKKNEKFLIMTFQTGPDSHG